MTENLPLFDAALRGMLLALLMLLAGIFSRDRPRLPAARAAVALLAGLCVQVVSSTPHFEAGIPRLWQAPLVAVAVGNAVLFWVFVQALCSDDFVFRPVHGAAWLAAALLGGLNCAWAAPTAAHGGSVVALLATGLQRALPLVFSVLTVLAASALWRADLVESRRRLRGFIVLAGVAYSLAMLAARLASPSGRLFGAVASLDVAWLLIIVAVVAIQLLRLGGSELFPPALAASRPGLHPLHRARDRTPDPLPDPVEARLAAALEKMMTADRIYRTEDLTLAALAARLQVPEYRLRRHINQRLGHRNFNAYINGFRLDDARVALADPGRRQLPVLSIALDAGFQSIGPFNRAFKAATGLTPSEFRRLNRADS